MAHHDWRVWCNTDSKWVIDHGDSTPTECPDDSGHSIDTSKTVDLGPVVADVLLESDDGTMYRLLVSDAGVLSTEVVT